MKMRLLLFVLVLISFSSVHAQADWLDQTFGSGGVITNRLDTASRVVSILVQPDNKVLALCNYSNDNVFINRDSVILYRFEANGAPDLSFGQAGAVPLILFFGGTGSNIMLQPDNKILVTMSWANTMFDNALIRLNADGSFDNSFGSNGIVYQNRQTVVSNGAILLDNSQYLLNVIEASGPCQSSEFTWFSAAGSVLSNTAFTFYDTLALGFLIRDMLEQPDHSILAVGLVWPQNISCQYSGLARFKPDGQLDSTFADKGMVYLTSRPITASTMYLSNIANSLIRQSDGKILIAGGLTVGHQDDSLFVARYTQDGHLDSTFADHGIFTFPQRNVYSAVEKIVLQADGKILLTGRMDRGYNEHPYLIRINNNGALDTSFGNSGYLDVALNGGGRYFTMALQTDGRIIVGGFEGGISDRYAHLLIARYLPSLDVGIIDFALDNNSTYIYPNPVKATAKLFYTLKDDASITLELLDVNGRSIRTLSRGESQMAGEHTASVILQDLAAGPYMISISSPAGRIGVKIIKE